MRGGAGSPAAPFSPRRGTGEGRRDQRPAEGSLAVGSCCSLEGGEGEEEGVRLLVEKYRVPSQGGGRCLQTPLPTPLGGLDRGV